MSTVAVMLPRRGACGAGTCARTARLLPLLALAGCSFFTRSTPLPQIYVLDAAVPQAPAATAAATAARVDPDPRAAQALPTLRLLRPLPAPGLDTERIAVLHPDGRLDYYTTGRWGAPVPEVIAEQALAQLRASGAWGAVADPRDVFNTDYVLRMAISRFDAEYAAEGAAPTVQVALQCLLLRRRDGQPVASFEAAGTADAAANRMGAVVAAFGAATHAALAAVAERLGQVVQNPDRPVASMNR